MGTIMCVSIINSKALLSSFEGSVCEKRKEEVERMEKIGMKDFGRFNFFIIQNSPNLKEQKIVLEEAFGR